MIRFLAPECDGNNASGSEWADRARQPDIIHSEGSNHESEMGHQ